VLLFWIAAALLSAAAAALVLWRARSGDDISAEAPELAVYQRHLAEQDELKARGLLGEPEWKASRAEAARRLLAAARPAPPLAAADPRRDRTVVLGAMLGAAALSIGIYAMVGAPGAADQPFGTRLQTWRQVAATDPGSLRPDEAAAVLAETAKAQPNNPDAWSFLGRARAAAGDYFGAAQALERAVAIRPGSSEDWTALGEALSGLAGGKPDADAVKAFQKAAALDPSAPGPRYDLGRAELMNGRKARGLALWREALALIPAGDPRRGALEAEIRAEETGRAPSAAEAIAAADPAAQEAAIRGMVAGLAARLDAEPDDAAGWEKLVRAYGVLGDADKRDRALARARVQFRDRPAELSRIEAAAR
jgi:cytochrome c-type biogenesis protein CcmH